MTWLLFFFTLFVCVDMCMQKSEDSWDYFSPLAIFLESNVGFKVWYQDACLLRVQFTGPFFVWIEVVVLAHAKYAFLTELYPLLT